VSRTKVGYDKNGDYDIGDAGDEIIWNEDFRSSGPGHGPRGTIPP
jgi:hypothetical protein